MLGEDSHNDYEPEFYHIVWLTLNVSQFALLVLQSFSNVFFGRLTFHALRMRCRMELHVDIATVSKALGRMRKSLYSFTNVFPICYM